MESWKDVEEDCDLRSCKVGGRRIAKDQEGLRGIEENREKVPTTCRLRRPSEGGTIAEPGFGGECEVGVWTRGGEDGREVSSMQGGCS